MLTTFDRRINQPEVTKVLENFVTDAR